MGCVDKKWDLNIGGGDNGIIVVFERGELSMVLSQMVVKRRMCENNRVIDLKWKPSVEADGFLFVGER